MSALQWPRRRGTGTLSVQPLVYRLRCKNGRAAADRAMCKTHVGRLSDAFAEAIRQTSA